MLIMKKYTLADSHEKCFEIIDDISKCNDFNIPNKTKLFEIKCKIDGLNVKKWEASKKRENLHEYIYTSSKKEKNICSIVPVSRSYFKIHEIIKDYDIYDDKLSCACIAEGPGGFIHSLNDNNSSKVYGITLISQNRKVPFWNQSILSNEGNIICNGADKTGDIYKIDNAKSFISMIGEDKCHLVTSDGGFDYSNDYNSQEDMSLKLLYCEIFIALNIQKTNGNFVIKFFDLFNYNTIKLVYILYNCYEKIHIYKPSTSRLSNSEKYVICSNFKGKSETIINDMIKYYNHPEKLIINIPETFIGDIIKYNNKFTEKQIEVINDIIKNMESENIDKPTNEQILIAKRWCSNYGLPLNDKCIYL